MPSGVKIGDVFMAMLLDSSGFQASAQSEGAKAGDAAGAAMSEGIKGRLGDLFKGSVFLGIGIDLGRQLLQGIESAVSDVVNVIPDMIRSGEAFALNIADITSETGASAESASRFAATLTYLGQSTDGLGMSLKTLSVQIASNEDKFTKLGIQTRDSNGKLLDTITILDNVRHYLSTAGDGATKMALATTLLGKSAGNLTQYLDLTDAQAAALNSTFDALGVTMTEKAVKDVQGATRESTLLGLAWQGLSNVLTAEVVPTIRQVLGAAFQFIVDHGAEVRQTLVDITNAALGLISGLLGISGITPFQTQLDGLASSSGNVTLSFDQWAQQMGYTVPVIDKTAEATKAASAANTAATKAIEAQTTALTALDKAQDKTYQTTLKSIKATLDQKTAALDAAEAERTLEQQQRDLNDQLNQAQLDLLTAQTGTKDNTTGAMVVSADDVSAAMAKIADIRSQQAELAHQTAVAAQKADIQSVKDYVDAIDQLVSNSTDKTATLADLKKREGALTAGGKPAAGSDAALELKAVLAAETRVKQQAANTANQNALDAKKAELAAETTATANADSAQVVADKKTLAQLKAQYQKYLDDQKTATATHILSVEEIITGDPKAGTGLGGALTKAFTDGQAAGEAFGKALTTVIDGLSTLIGAFVGPGGPLGMLKDTMVELDWLAHPTFTLQGVLGPDLYKLVTGVAPDLTKSFGSGIQPVGSQTPTGPGITYVPSPSDLKDYPQTSGPLATPDAHRAAGGPVAAGVPYVIGERRPEVFVPGENGTIIPSIAALGGMAAGGQETIEVPVYLDGEVITRVVARRLSTAYRR